MDTVSPAFDSRAMPLAEPSTAPSAFSWWGWLEQWIAPVRREALPAAEPQPGAIEPPAEG